MRKTNAIDISKCIQERYSFATALAVNAALGVAAERWTEKDTKVFGTVARDKIREMIDAAIDDKEV